MTVDMAICDKCGSKASEKNHDCTPKSHRAMNKGVAYFLQGRVKHIESNEEEEIFEVIGKHGTYKVIYNKLNRYYECFCKEPYIKTSLKRPYPFCSHCWAMINWIKNQKVQLGDAV